jgi:hypothetical protein
MDKLRSYAQKADKVIGGLLVALPLAALAGFYGTADSNLTSAVSSVTSYFSANIGTVITGVIGIAVFLWLLRIAFRSFGVRKPRSVD